MSTARVTITIDEGVYRDALTAAAEHDVSVSAWITRCTRVETMRDALTRHQQWCEAEGLTGLDDEQRRPERIADAAAELDRSRATPGRDSGDAA